jgi:hypothetical protein
MVSYQAVETTPMGLVFEDFLPREGYGIVPHSNIFLILRHHLPLLLVLSLVRRKEVCRLTGRN